MDSVFSCKMVIIWFTDCEIRYMVQVSLIFKLFGAGDLKTLKVSVVIIGVSLVVESYS